MFPEFCLEILTEHLLFALHNLQNVNAALAVYLADF